MATTSVGLSGALVVIHICLIAISFVAIKLLPPDDNEKGSLGLVVVWALVPLMATVFAEDYYETWRGLLGDLAFPAVPRTMSFLAVFFIEIIFVAVMIVRTGGARRSPFTSLLLLLPSLAIFLQEPRSRFLLYTLVCAAIYTATLRISYRGVSVAYDRMAFSETFNAGTRAEDRSVLVTNLLCLGLATLIGYITAPRNS